MTRKLALFLVLLTTAVTARAAVEMGDIAQVDEVPSCMDEVPDVAPLVDGGFVAVWMASVGDQPFGRTQLLGRLLDRDGRPRGPALRIDAGNAAPWEPAVATDIAGNFMVIWTEQGTGAIRGRVFSSSGTPLGTELVIASPAPYTYGTHLVAEQDGGFTVVWQSALTLLRRRYTAEGEPLGLAETLTQSPAHISTDAAAHGHSGTVVVWMERDAQIRGGIFRPGSSPVIFPIHTYTREALSRFWFQGPVFAVASRADGTFLVAWRDVVPNTRPAVFVRSFNGAGQPLGPAVRADNATDLHITDLWGLDATVDSAGNFVVGWHDGSLPGSTRQTLYVRTFGPDGTPRGPAVEAAGAQSREAGLPALVGGREGRTLLLWQDGRRFDSITLPLYACFSRGIYARPLFTSCAGGESLCLQDGRFQVRVTWNLPDGQTGQGQPIALTRESGTFWFFGANNVELAVKILDGRAENGHFWVFYGSLSDVGYTITIDDTVTGATRTYVNPHSTLASRSDITAFPAAPAAGSESVVAASSPSHLPPSDSAGPCNDPFPIDVRRPGLCLNGHRFEVEVAWHDPFHGTSGIATGVPLTQDSGYFWFFGEDNLELVVKVLDGRSYNGKFWVFYGALTNVEYTVRVRHAASGAERVYHNPPFQFRSRSDIDAFVIEE